ncbi:MAG: CPBP family intramembrane metalloprotease [Candidatus Omnitrophica bacterium]|nr:CPBP family intramembrane metalloprotease [Candidatus Omnitrophota bacterium]
MGNKKELLLWLLTAVAGLTIFLLFFNHAFPIASIDIRLDKTEVLSKAMEFIKAQGVAVKDFDRTILFDSDYTASVFLQKKLGIKKANEVIKKEVPVWFWSLRWFKELQKEGLYCAVDPATGEIIGFEHSLLEDAEGANLNADEALVIAKEKVVLQGINLQDYELKENTQKQQRNRTDHYFTWEKKDYSIDQAHLRLSISVCGDTLGSFNRYLDVPEEFIRQLQKELSFGQVLSLLTIICMFALGISALVIFVIKFKEDSLRIKFGLFYGIVVMGLSLADFLNSIPLLWAAYPDTMSKGVFISISLVSALLGALIIGVVIFLFGNSGECLSRQVWASKLFLLEAIKNKQAGMIVIARPFIVGYSLGFVFLGYVTSFYLIAIKFFNIWMPPEAEYSNILGTSMPFLFPLTVAASAALSEEFMFRLFSISFFKKYFKLTWLSVLIPALVWAFAHSNYPVFPAYIRGIELTVAGIIFGMVFLRYGLESVIIAHFVIDAVLAAMPLLKSHNPYFVLSGLIVIALAFLPLPVLCLFLNKKRKTAPVTI